ncbi:hypothetical protein [Rhizobacter fulvus]
MLAATFAGERRDTGLGNLVAWHVDERGDVGTMLHRDWDSAFEAIERIRPAAGIGLTAEDIERWNSEAVRALPASCFVWLEELRRVIVRSHFVPGTDTDELDDMSDDVTFICARSTDMELNLSPPGMSDAMVFFVREGFAPPEGRGAETARSAPPHQIMPPSSLANTTRQHLLGRKSRDVLTPAIEYAQTLCRSPADTSEVFARLEALAQEEHAPLLAATPRGVKYSKGGEDRYLTRDALHKRLHPETRERRR